MGRELIKIVELDASPEQVWQAIATGPGISTWFVPHQVEPGPGGAMSAQFGAGNDVTGRILVWEPERRIVFGAAETPPEGTADYAFEFLVEGRDGGGTVLRFVQSGFLDEGWEDEYSSLDTGWDLFFGNLRSYLTHFAGQPVHNVVTMAFVQGSGADAWKVLLPALGLTGRPEVGDTLT
ncbi:MAG TPA: SRPBCC domain-containing protein, partial [Pseudonocardia sp.]|nr:SRPBCC domain-containing protein [Pseudonocardia sp.]